jgi:hypothetical protein
MLERAHTAYALHADLRMLQYNNVLGGLAPINDRPMSMSESALSSQEAFAES